MSAFRRKILKLDEATLQDHGVLPAEGGLMKAGVTDKPCTDEKGKRRGREAASGGRRVDGGVNHSEQRGSEVGAGKDERSEWKEVPFSWVVRGRQESHLVDQQVRIPKLDADSWPQPCSFRLSDPEATKFVSQFHPFSPR